MSLLVTDSNLGPISHHFRDTATLTSIENCSQTLQITRHDYYRQSIESCQRPIWWYHRRPPMTYRLATILHNWHKIMRYNPSRSSKVIDFHVIWKPTCDFLLMINSNLNPISHRLATIHLWQRDRWTTTHTNSLNETEIVTLLLCDSSRQVDNIRTEVVQRCRPC